MSQTKPQNLIPLLCFFLFAIYAPKSSSHTILTNQNVPKTRGLFAFGSSTVDNGNNNFLTNSLITANYLPYGIDFPLGPTGRFTNGRNLIDVLVEKLNLPNYIPPFSDPSTNGTKILHGVNYGSGDSGILDDTGLVSGNVTSLNQQITNFETVTLPQLDLLLGNQTRKMLSQFLFVIQSAGNDYSLNYFMSNTSVTVEDFTANLTATFTNQLKRLYGLGARKFVLIAIYPSGCSPSARARAPPGSGCVQIVNDAVQLFNNNLKNLADTIRPQLPGSNLVFVNAYKFLADILRFPRLRGFLNSTSPCCDVTVAGRLCQRGGLVCANRNTYVYFDGIHVTEAVNIVVASKAFASNLRDEVYPFNVKTLADI